MYNTFMKKLFISLFLLLSSFSFAAQPLMIIHPFRETILHFPSVALPEEELVVTVFLPEQAVPLAQKYPVVYVLDLGPKQAQEIKKLQDAYAQKALVVGISLGKNASATEGQISEFLARELVPYISANYSTQEVSSARALVLYGPQRAELAGQLLSRKNLFGRFAFAHGGDKAVSLAGAEASLRTLLVGRRGEVIAWQKALEESGYPYGAGFAAKLVQDPTVEQAIDLDYLFSSDEAVGVKKLAGAVYPRKIDLQAGKAYLALAAVLNNGGVYDYLPLSVRLSPPYLDWKVLEGVLNPISGAEAGKVKLSIFVDKVKFERKIYLKK